MRPARSFYKRSRIYDLLRSSTLPTVAELVLAGVLGRVGVGLDSFLQEVRSQRENGEVVPLPSLTIGLEEYSARIIPLEAECRKLGVRCFFMAQPSMYRERLTLAEEELLWGMGPAVGRLSGLRFSFRNGGRHPCIQRRSTLGVPAGEFGVFRSGRKNS